MNLRSYGCSFIFGTDLDDAEMVPHKPVKASQKTWPALLANHFNYNYRCRAYPGCGNLMIAERIFLDLPKLCQHKTLVVIGWTWIDRFDYNDPNFIDNWNTIRPVADDERATFYYKNLHSEYRDKLTSLLIIKSVIDTLKEKNLPFLMTYIDDLLFDKRWNLSPAVETLQSYVLPFMTQFDGKNFLEWSKDQEFAISEKLHPLESAHRAAASYMIKFFDKQKIIDPTPPVHV